MIVTETTKARLAFRREERDMLKAGFKRHETDWEIHRGFCQGKIITDAIISVDGKYVYTKLGMPNI